jgi:ArsR family transcriptional regulator, arsenate/arsenite/antimonite-responsive transcriptional repressor
MSPRERRRGGRCAASVQPALSAAAAPGLAKVLKALGDPTRLRIVDALRTASPEALCQCELTPLFDMSQQALSKHLKVLSEAGVIGAERRGLWTYHFVLPGALEEVRAWLS